MVIRLPENQIRAAWSVLLVQPLCAVRVTDASGRPGLAQGHITWPRALASHSPFKIPHPTGLGSAESAVKPAKPWRQKFTKQTTHLLVFLRKRGVGDSPW